MTTFLEFDNFDPQVRPQDDLYRHVNGAWLARTQIPADKPVWGSFTILRENAQAAVQDIITSLPAGQPKGTPEQQISDLFASFMDTDAIEARGAEPLAPLLRRVDDVNDVEALTDLFGWLMGQGFGSLIGSFVDADPGNPSLYTLFLGQAGIGLPDEKYYRADEHAEVREKYLAHIERLLTLAHIDDAAASAQMIFDLETKIASHHWDNVRCRDLVQMTNPMTADELATAYPTLNVARQFTAGGLQMPAQVIAAQPSFLADVQELLVPENLAAWRAWARWRIISGLAMYLSSDFVDERFGFVGTTLAGTPQLKERWRRGVELVEGCLAEAVGKIYVDRHYSDVAEERMQVLVANILEAYRQSITDLEWMTDETKTQALDKLSKFRPKIGHPATYRDYSALDISRGDLIGNIMNAHAHELAFEMAKVDRNVDPDEWLMPPQTVNAYYHPLRNEIVFPAAILQPPFFHPDADDAINYGGIGAVIGHEIGHGFDDQGSTCDGDGLLRDWWTESDREAFNERAKVLIEQYNELSPAEVPDQKVNGELTIGENIGDLGGLGIALKAYALATKGQDVPLIDDLTGVQRLFLSWGTIWQMLAREETMRQRLAVDPHSPAEFRCNQIVRNVDAFYDAFDVQPGDAMWLEPNQRVSIW